MSLCLSMFETLKHHILKAKEFWFKSTARYSKIPVLTEQTSYHLHGMPQTKPEMASSTAFIQTKAQSNP